MSSLDPGRKAGLRRELEGLLGKGAVLSDPEELLVYESDGLTLFQALADFVVFPTSVEQVAAVVRLAGREGLPFVARGAGTGLSGGCLPAEGGLVISMMRMNRVLEVDYENQLAVVEPGLVNLHLSWAVGPKGYYYAPDPSSQQACTPRSAAGTRAAPRRRWSSSWTGSGSAWRRKPSASCRRAATRAPARCGPRATRPSGRSSGRGGNRPSAPTAASHRRTW